MATRTRPSLATCSAVILTTSENSNMVFLRDGAATGAPATADKRTLVGGYVAWIGLWPSPMLLAAEPWDCDSHGASSAAHLQVLAHIAALGGDGRGCEGFHFDA